MIAIAILPLLLMCAWQRADTVAAMTREERRPVEPKAEADHRAVLEIGGAAAWSVTERSASGGGTLAMEITPIEHWLELEGGITILGAGRQRELSIDLLLKKPWQLTPTVEFMAGIGPEFSRKLGRDENGTRLGAEIVLDFMFWMGPTVGWYVEAERRLCAWKEFGEDGRDDGGTFDRFPINRSIRLRVAAAEPFAPSV